MKQKIKSVSRTALILFVVLSVFSGTVLAVDLTTYTETDPDDRLSVQPNSVTFDGLENNDNAALRSNQPNFSQNARIITFETEVTNRQNNGHYLFGFTHQDITQANEVSFNGLWIDTFPENNEIRIRRDTEQIATPSFPGIGETIEWEILFYPDQDRFILEAYHNDGLIISERDTLPDNGIDFFYPVIARSGGSSGNNVDGIVRDVTIEDYNPQNPEDLEDLTTFEVRGIHSSKVFQSPGQIDIIDVQNDDDLSIVKNVSDRIEGSDQFTYRWGRTIHDEEALLHHSNGMTLEGETNLQDEDRFIGLRSHADDQTFTLVDFSNKSGTETTFDKSYTVGESYYFFLTVTLTNDTNTATLDIYNNSGHTDLFGQETIELQEPVELHYVTLYTADGGVSSDEAYLSYFDVAVNPSQFDFLEQSPILELDIQNWMKHDTSQPATVYYSVNGTTTEVTNQAVLTSEDSDIISISNNILTATNDTSVNSQIIITATYEGETTIQNVTVANRTIDNIEIMPSSQWFASVMGFDESGNYHIFGAEIQWIFVAILIGSWIAWIARNEFLGLGVIVGCLIFFWTLDEISLGILLVGVFYGLFAGYQLQQTPSRSDTNVGANMQNRFR